VRVAVPTPVSARRPARPLVATPPVRTRLDEIRAVAMRIRGVSYDVGRVLGVNWRPEFNQAVVRRELEIVRDDLHCNSVRVCARDAGRLDTAAEMALDLGLEVWYSPELWNRSPRRTLAYLEEAAQSAERIRARTGGQIVFSVGSELTLFMRGIVPGASLLARIRAFRRHPQRYGDGTALNAFLKEANTRVRHHFGGPLTYASLIWESVDWAPFDIIGIDDYRDARIKDRYTTLLKKNLVDGKPVVITEFGMRSYVGADSSGTLGLGVVSIPSMVLHQVPLIGRFVRPRLKGHHVRDESLQAREIIETLCALDDAGVEGAFVCTFTDYLSPADDDPRYDLDMSSLSLVKYTPRRRGLAYPDLEWEPKESFRAVAQYFASAANHS
jgi:hypothetical protein